MSEMTYVYVWVDAADGPALVAHTEEEYAALWQGVDRDVTEVMGDE